MGCGFEHQLASIARALGADGAPAPASNAGFLRPDAQLAIIVLSNEDDCSAPANTQLYSLNGGQQNLANQLGPIANYRCNQFGHLCVDPSPAAAACLTEPPLQPPRDVQATASGVDAEPDRLPVRRQQRPAHPGQGPGERHQGAQGRPRQSDRRRGDRRAPDPVHGRLGSRAGRPEHATRRALASGGAFVRPGREATTSIRGRPNPRPTAASAIRRSGSRSGCRRSARTACWPRSATATTGTRSAPSRARSALTCQAEAESTRVPSQAQRTPARSPSARKPWAPGRAMD